MKNITFIFIFIYGIISIQYAGAEITNMQNDVAIAPVDTPIVLKIEGTGFDGNEAIRISGARCILWTRQLGDNYFTQVCTGYKLGKQKVSVYDVRFNMDIDNETPGESEYLEFVLVDKSKPSEFNQKYGWWIDYVSTSSGSLERARQIRGYIKQKELIQQQKILKKLQTTVSYNPESIHSGSITRVKNILAIQERKYMEEYYIRLLPYIDPTKKELFRIFVNAATDDAIKTLNGKVDEIVLKKGFDSFQKL